MAALHLVLLCLVSSSSVLEAVPDRMPTMSGAMSVLDGIVSPPSAIRTLADWYLTAECDDPNPDIFRT
jgi:hypothetical protein